MFLLCSNWVQLWRRLRVWIRHIYLPMSRTRPDHLDPILAHLHLETLDPGISTLGLEMSTFTFWSVSMIVIWHVWIYRWFCWPATSSRDPFMKFQLLAFIFPTLACVHFLLAASWFLFALSGPLFFTFMSVQILTSFYLKILYSILSLSRALSGPQFFLFNCRSNSWLFSLIICAALSLQFWVCNFMRHLNVRLGILVSMSSLRAVFLFCQATRYMYIRLAQATICAIAIDHRVVFWLVKICPHWHFPTFNFGGALGYLFDFDVWSLSLRFTMASQPMELSLGQRLVSTLQSSRPGASARDRGASAPSVFRHGSV